MDTNENFKKGAIWGGGLFLGHLMQTMPTSADAHRCNKSKKEKQRIIGNIQLKLTGILRSTSGMAMFKIFKLSDVWVLSAGCAVAGRGPSLSQRGGGRGSSVTSVSGSSPVTATRGETAGGVCTHGRCPCLRHGRWPRQTALFGATIAIIL